MVHEIIVAPAERGISYRDKIAGLTGQIHAENLYFLKQVINAKYDSFQDTKREIKAGLLVTSKLACLIPLIHLSAATVVRLTTSEKLTLYVTLFHLILRMGEKVKISEILKKGFTEEQRFEHAEGILHVFATERDFAFVNNPLHAIGVLDLQQIWLEYAKLRSQRLQRLQTPYQLDLYHKCYLLFHFIKASSAIDCTQLKEFVQRYQISYQTEPCPEGSLDGWNNRLLALREVAMVYSTGVATKVWDGQQEIDAFFPQFSNLFEQAILECVDQKDPQILRAEIDFLFNWNKKKEQNLPWCVTRGTLILQTLYQLRHPVGQESVEPLYLFLIESDRSLQPLLGQPSMQTLLARACTRLRERGMPAEIGCKAFVKAFLTHCYDPVYLRLFFDLLLMRIPEQELPGILNFDPVINEKVVEAALRALPFLKEAGSTTPAKLAAALPKTPALTRFNAQIISPTQEEMIHLGDFLFKTRPQ